MTEHSKRVFPDIGFPPLAVPRSRTGPILSICLAHGLVLAIAVSLVTWDAHASWTAWKGARARIEMTPAAGGAFSYRPFGLANPTSLTTTMATMLHKVTLQNQGAVQDIYVGHVATSGWLMELNGVMNDDAMHPDWPAVEAGAAYIGEPDKNPGPPVQYGWDSIGNVYLFHVATVGIGGQEPTVPPSADGHQHLH